jgi:DNA-binding GntR family transcriptional regulator
MSENRLATLVRQPRLRDQAYLALRDMLRSGTFPADGAVENELAAQLNVSRTPVREALFQLCREGFLEDTGRGYRVPELSATDMEEIIELRLMIEPDAAALAVTRADAAAVRAIKREAENEAKAHRAGDVGAFIAANAALRMRLLESCGNRRVSQVLGGLDDQIQRLRARTLTVAENRELTIAQHAKVIAALVARDGDAAARAMRVLLKAARKYYASLW